MVEQRRNYWLAAILIAAAFFAAAAPTLVWVEFSSSMENLVAATALETRRDGSWMLPTLEKEPRLAKPPLAGWVTAAGIRPSTFAHLNDPDPAPREAAYLALAWDIRWPGLLCSCLMLLAVFDLGKTIAGPPIGLIGMTICGSTLFLLRFGRQATTDVQLALWVTIANAAMARLVLIDGRSWKSTIVAGVALGLALMSKGPVALLQTLPPVVILALWRRQTRIPLSRWVAIVGLMLIVGCTWFVFVLIRVPYAAHVWNTELFHANRGTRPDPIYNYAIILLDMLPWTPAMIHGSIWTAVEAWRARRREMALPRQAEGMILALLLVYVPIALMTCSPDRKDRYLLPLVGAASILGARSVEAMLDPEPRPRRLPAAAVWITVAVMGVGLPIAGATVLKRVGASVPWYPPIFAACAGCVIAMLIVIAIQQSRRFAFLLVIAPAAVMLMLAPLFFLGYRDSREGRADVLPLVRTIRFVAPDAEMYNWRPDSNKRGDVAFAIYLNRPSVWVADPAKLPPSAKPQVMITIVSRKEPAPEPPADWMKLDETPRDNDRCIAFIRLPEAPDQWQSHSSRP